MVGAGAVAPVAAGGRTANNGVRKVAPEQNLRPVAHCAIAAEVEMLCGGLVQHVRTLPFRGRLTHILSGDPQAP